MVHRKTRILATQIKEQDFAKWKKKKKKYEGNGERFKTLPPPE